MNIQVTLNLPDEVMALLRRIADNADSQPVKKATRKTGAALTSTPPEVVEQPEEVATVEVSAEQVVVQAEKTVSTAIDAEALRKEIRAIFGELLKDGKKDLVGELLQKRGASKLSEVAEMNLPLLLDDVKDAQ